MEIIEIIAYHRSDFRKWLAKNHSKEHKVKVVLYKRHTGASAPSHRELMEEAICYGWIDTTIKRLDEDRFIRNFSRRNKNSRWSDNTLSYARQLIKEGKMTPHGLAFYKQGKAKPTHDHGIPKDPQQPLALTRALTKNRVAKENFKTFSRSTKRTIYRWILGAKLPKTRTKRIERVVALARQGKKNIF